MWCYSLRFFPLPDGLVTKWLCFTNTNWRASCSRISSNKSFWLLFAVIELIWSPTATTQLGGSNNFPIYLARVQCLRMAANPSYTKTMEASLGDITASSQMFHLFVTKSPWQGRVTHTTTTQVHRHVHTKNPEYTQGRACLHSLPPSPFFSLSSLGTIGVSKCQRSTWIAAVITVKAGHQWDARLTLLTCLHQHTWTASLAEQQFSHGASQNKVHCSHTPHWPKSSPPLRTMLICCIHTESTKTTCCSHEIKRPLNPGESPYFLLISPVKSTSSVKGRRQKN